jgi:cytochrome P450
MEGTATPVSPALANTPLREIDALAGPRAWPVLGNLPQVQPQRIHRDVEQWSQRYGPLFRLRFGRTPILVVSSHELVREVLRDRPDGFRRPSVTARVSDEMGGSPGVFLAEGSAWRDQRRMVMASLAPHAVKSYFPALLGVALRLQRRWQGAARGGHAIDLSADLKRYSVDIIAGLAFGTEVNTVEGDENVLQRHMEVILAAVARRSFSLIPYWRYFKLPVDRRLDRSIAALRGAIEGLVRDARLRLQADPARAARPANLLESMICAAAEGNSGVDDAAVIGNVSTMLLAGEDTTANTLAWMLYLLQKHPAALAKAREEVLRIAPDPSVLSIEQVDALVYVDACAQEAMRHKPVAPFLPLEALRDTSVGDVRVGKGALVWCVMRHDSLDERHFRHAGHFEPERWLQKGADAVDKQISTPFGSGARTCPGRYLAMMEIKIAMAMLLSRFDIVSVDTAGGADPQEVMGFTMAPAGLLMRLQEKR